MSTQRTLTMAAVNSIMSKRSPLPATMVGKKVRFTVQGDGNIIDVLDKNGKEVMSSIPGEEGTVLQKKIFNLKVSSALALANARNRQYLKDAYAAEKAGDAVKADELYNQFLNSTQVSFGILLPSKVADKITNGADIAGTVQLIETDNGKLLTIDASTIQVLEPEMLASAAAFNVADFLGTEEETAGE